MAQDPDKPLDMVIYSEHIISPFKASFPNTYELMQYNTIGTLKLLKSLEILTAKKFTETAAADNKGDDNYRTWSEYKEMIEENLQKISGISDWRMAKARIKISEVIHNQYFKKFPCWPAPGKSQSGYVYITCSDTHKAESGDQKFQVTWSCEGGVTVKDKTDLITISDTTWFFGLLGSKTVKKKYYCEMVGQPTFKIMYVDLNKLLQIESKFGQKMIELKAQVDQLNNKDAEAEKLGSKLDALLGVH